MPSSWGLDPLEALRVSGAGLMGAGPETLGVSGAGLMGAGPETLGVGGAGLMGEVAGSKA